MIVILTCPASHDNHDYASSAFPIGSNGTLNIAYMQGLGHVADIIRVWGWACGASAGLGLHHQDFLPKSLSTHEALFFLKYRRDISEAHVCSFWRQALPGMPAMLGPRSTKRCKYRQKLLC